MPPADESLLDAICGACPHAVHDHLDAYGRPAHCNGYLSLMLGDVPCHCLHPQPQPQGQPLGNGWTQHPLPPERPLSQSSLDRIAELEYSMNEVPASPRLRANRSEMDPTELATIDRLYRAWVAAGGLEEARANGGQPGLDVGWRLGVWRAVLQEAFDIIVPAMQGTIAVDLLRQMMGEDPSDRRPMSVPTPAPPPRRPQTPPPVQPAPVPAQPQQTAPVPSKPADGPADDPRDRYKLLELD